MSRFVNPTIQYLNDSGEVLAEGSVTFYVTGTSILATIYQDAGLAVPTDNPMPLDSYGRPENPIFLNPDVVYRVVVKDSDGATVDDQDPVTGYVSAEEFSELEEELTDQIETLSNQVATVLANLYPIGSWYITEDVGFDPANVFGGTWILTSKGRAPFGYDPDNAPFNTAGANVGASTVTLTTPNLPVHDHPSGVGLTSTGPAIYSSTATGVPGNATSHPDVDAGAPTQQPVTGPTGSATPFSIIPPGLVVCIWKRVS